MNGQNLFDGSSQSVIKDDSGNFYSYNNANLAAAALTDLTTGDVDSVNQWETSINLWQVSKAGYTINSSAWKLGEDAYEVVADGVTINRLKKDLWYNGGSVDGSWSDTDNGGTKYSKHSFIKSGTGSGSQNVLTLPFWTTGVGYLWAEQITDGSKYLTEANPMAAPLGNLESGDFTFLSSGSFTTANPNTNTIDPPDTTEFTAGSFVASDPGLGASQTAVSAGDFISVNPASEDNAATYYAAGSIVSSDPTGVDTGASEVAYAHVLTSLGAGTSITKIKTALDQVTTDRSSLGAAGSRLQRINDHLSLLGENLSQAVSRMKDTDVAAESTRFAKHQILIQSSMDMIDKARIVSEKNLRLLINF